MSNSPQRANGRPGVWLAASIGALALVASIGFAGVNHLGLVPTGAAVPVVDPDAPTALDLASSPASVALNAALAAAPAEWARTGVQKASIAAPFPFSCTQTGTVPVISESQDYTIAGTPAKITLTAYTAGLGGEALALLNKGAAACKAGADTISQTALNGIGAEAQTLTLTRSGSAASVVTFRRGDIVGFVAAVDGNVSADVARTLDQLLAPMIETTCIGQTSVAADAARNPFGVTGYVPFSVPETVTVKDPGLPKVPKTETYAQQDLTVAIEIPAAVTPNTLPAYPVWPLMPPALEVPVALASPAATPPTSSTLSVASADADGPGCGWAFTGMTAPSFDEKAGAVNAKKQVAAAEESQSAAVKAWSKAVLAYWKAYEPKVVEVTAYRAYADQVNTVNAAWNRIAAEWEGYNATHAVYQGELAAQTKFLTEQSSAGTAYSAAIATCEATPAPSATPTPTPSPTSTPRPTPTPSAAPVPPVDCRDTVPRPPILDEAPPAVRAEPAKPADPRPQP